MYYPFIRGKQFELVMLREMAPKIAEWGFVPIIEPVKGNFPALKRGLDKLIEHNCRFILIANPSVGELKENSSSLWSEIIDGVLQQYENYSVGFSLTKSEELQTAGKFFEEYDSPFVLIHNGFSEGKALSELIENKEADIIEHIFVGQDNKLYRRHFKNIKRVLVQDCFHAQSNRDYPSSEPFSELYLTYSEDGFQAFGDFLTVSGEYKEGGGPAYAIAIHLTYVDPVADNSLSIKHYVSNRIQGTEDPAGKFQEALEKLVEDVEDENSLIYQSTAVLEYVQLFKDQHFPGLGYVKKLSMQHHLELMAHLLVKG